MTEPFFETKLGKLYMGDCLELLLKIPHESIDMILCDLPYGTTECEWDCKINLSVLFEHYSRIITRHGAIVLTGQQPFVTELINNLSPWVPFRYELIWEKGLAVGFLDAKRKPMRAHENIEIFYKASPVYNPQMTQGKPLYRSRPKLECGVYGQHKGNVYDNKTGERYPRSVLRFSHDANRSITKASKPDRPPTHPTAKPQALFEWLIKTYTNEGMLVLDNCIGGGTTAAACEVLNRRWIGMELKQEYCEMTKNRVEALLQQGRLDFNAKGREAE